MTRIKICGITNRNDALKAVELGADAIGFVFADSPRQIDSDKVLEIVKQLPSYIARVGVFVNEKKEMIETIYQKAKLSEVQLYCDIEANLPAVPYLRSLRVKDEKIIDQIEKLGLISFHLDTYDQSQAGGTGKSFDWDIAALASKKGKLTLAGGLTPENIKSALDKIHPYAVDLSSGVEKSPGLKDHEKMKLFIDKVRQWDSRTN